MRKPDRKFSKVLMSLATAWTFLWMGSACNRLVIYSTASLYRPVRFKVTDAIYSNDDSLANYWLIGTVEGQEERLIPIISRGSVHSSEDLLRQFPRGKEIDALFNPLMPRAIVQGETLRVRHDTGQHWDLEQIARNRLISVWLIPTLFPLPCPLLYHPFLPLYLHPFPEGNIARNLPGSFLGFRIIPGSILIDLPIHFNGVIAGNSLPATGSMGVTIFEVFLLNCIGGKVVIPFNNFALVTFGKNSTIPNGFWHRYLHSMNLPAKA